MNESDEQNLLLGNLPRGVSVVGSEILSPSQLEHKERLTRLQDDSWALHEAVETWKAQQVSERSLRQLYANVLLFALCLETIFASTMFVLIGCGKLQVDKWVADMFFLTVFGQIASGVIGVTKYLFPPNAVDSFPLELIRLQKGVRGSPKRGKTNAN